MLFTPGETVRIRVQPGLARLLVEEEPKILSEAQAALGIEVELIAEEGFDGYEVVRS